MSLRVRLIESPGGREGPHQFLTSYLVEESVAIDAGSLGFWGSPQQQAKVRHLFLSHSHIDHIASLPMFLENTGRYTEEPLVLHASEPVWQCLQQDIFNGQVAAPLETAIPNRRKVCHRPLQAGDKIDVGPCLVQAVEVNHVVPTLGFLLHKGESCVVIASDTGPTDQIWQEAEKTNQVSGIFLEATFPDSMEWLAKVSKHLTPSLFAKEVGKLASSPQVVAVHIKARFYDKVVEELKALDMPNLVIGEAGKEYSF